MDLIERYAHCEPGALPGVLEERLQTHPHCAVSHYLLGCVRLDGGRVATATRCFMVASRADVRLQSAALLAFTGLCWISRRNDALLPVIVDTWTEFRRPPFDETRIERTLLDAFAEPDPGLAGISPLAQRLWRLPIRTLRAELREAAAATESEKRRLLAAFA